MVGSLVYKPSITFNEIGGSFTKRPYIGGPIQVRAMVGLG